MTRASEPTLAGPIAARVSTAVRTVARTLRDIIAQRRRESPNRQALVRGSAGRSVLKANVIFIILLTAVVCATGGVALIRGVSVAMSLSAQARHDTALAHDGAQELQQAADVLAPLREHPRRDTAPIAAAQRHLLTAFDDFRLLNNDISAIPPVAATLGAYGELIGAAQRLTPLAIEATEASIVACDALALVVDRLGDPLAKESGGLTEADLQTLTKDIATVDTLFHDAEHRMAQLRSSDLRADPRIAKAVAAFRLAAPQVDEWLRTVQPALPVLASLIGVESSANYLLEVMDSTELRPSGGFIGNYGILTLSGGRLAGLHVEDVDLLDAPYKYGSKRIPVPAVYQWFAQLIDHWAFRDSNLDADFPTAARYGEQLYTQEGGTTPVQGVIAITPWLLRDALKITGPVDLAPDYNETVTSVNLVERIHYHQLTAGVVEGPDSVRDPGTGTSLRKRFTGVLFQHFMDKVKQQASKDIAPLLHLLVEGLHSKDVQIYLNSDQAEQLLRQLHLDAAILAPTVGDSFFAVDANISANKSNGVLQYQMEEQITLDASGGAAHQTTLAYTWPDDPATLNQTYPYTTSLPNVLHSYQRLYLPPAATITQTEGWSNTASGAAFGRQVFSGDYQALFAQTKTLRLTWKNPQAVARVGALWRYSELLQKQAGVTYDLHLSVTLPACATLTSAPPAGFTWQDGHTLTAHLPFATEMPIMLEYRC